MQDVLTAWVTRATEPLPAPLAGGDPDRARLYALVAPLIRHGLERLTPAVERLLDKSPDGPCDAQTAIAAWCVNLPGFIGALVGAVALAVNIARVQGILGGETPEERFASFARQLVRPDGSSDFFTGSPVLTRLLLIGLDQWVEAGLAFLTHLRDDWPAIRATSRPMRQSGRWSRLAAGPATAMVAGGRPCCCGSPVASALSTASLAPRSITTSRG